MAQAVEASHDVMLSSYDQSIIHKTLLAVKKKQWTTAKNEISKTDNVLAHKLYNWLYYTKSKKTPDFASLSSFIYQNPDWPLQGRLVLKAEKAMNSDLSDDEIVDWFQDYPPRTSDGMARYLAALDRTRHSKAMKRIFRAWWGDTLLTTAQQNYFLDQYGYLLNRDVQIRRLDTLLFNRHYTNARAIARLIGHGYPALVKTRIALSEEKGGLDHLVASVPRHLRDDPGLLYERLRWRRRHKKDFGAIQILHRMPPSKKISNLNDWWIERHIIVRRLIEKKQYQSAYNLVKKHQQKEGLSFAQAEFLSGWLALRFVKDPWQAFEHFEKLYKNTSTPLSQARAAYWAGQASDALGHPEIARQWYQVSARYPTAFYGQLAGGLLDVEYKPPQRLSPEKTIEGQQRFSKKEMTFVTRMLSRAGLRKDATGFLYAQAKQAQTPEDYVLIADLAEELEHYHNAIYIAKRAEKRGIFLMDHAYPTLISRMKNVSLEWALVHALIRQESAFDDKVKSPVGARGLMQLMPTTARSIARKYHISHKTSWLTTNPDYNIRLGVKYLEQMLNHFNDSYPLALAAYNAGPNRVDQWLKEFGDPRTPDINIVDWIELIPVYETRNYVQRVLEGVYVYRLKLMDIQNEISSPTHVALRMTE